MTAPLPKLQPQDCPLQASPKMIYRQKIERIPSTDKRTDAEKYQDLRAGQAFKSLYPLGDQS